MNFKKTSFIYSVRKRFCRKIDIHNNRYCRETNSSFLPDSQIYLYYFLHLWPFNRTPPTWWCSRRFFAHHKLDIKNISSIKGMTSQETEGSWSSIGDFWHFRYHFFVTLLTVWDYYILIRIFPEVHTIPIPLFPPLKNQIFFRLLH